MEFSNMPEENKKRFLDEYGAAIGGAAAGGLGGYVINRYLLENKGLTSAIASAAIGSLLGGGLGYFMSRSGEIVSPIKAAAKNATKEPAFKDTRGTVSKRIGSVSGDDKIIQTKDGELVSFNDIAEDAQQIIDNSVVPNELAAKVRDAAKSIDSAYYDDAKNYITGTQLVTNAVGSGSRFLKMMEINEATSKMLATEKARLRNEIKVEQQILDRMRSNRNNAKVIAAQRNKVYRLRTELPGKLKNLRETTVPDFRAGKIAELDKKFGQRWGRRLSGNLDYDMRQFIKGVSDAKGAGLFRGTGSVVKGMLPGLATGAKLALPRVVIDALRNMSANNTLETLNEAAARKVLPTGI